MPETECDPEIADPEIADTEILAECAGVSRVFGRFTAVDGVDLAVGSGEVVGLLGANGAGKTTLIRMLLGLLPVSGGSVRLFGQPPSRASRRRVGYLPQGLGLYDDLTIAENLAFSRAVFAGAGTGPDLPDSLRRYATVAVRDLPLGVARRAAFAQVLAHAPDLLLLDEPTSGVDPLARARLWETISQAAADGAGVIVTTHNMEEAEECTRLVVLAGGRVVAAGTAAQIVGPARTAVVRAADWAAALRRLEAAGLRAVLAGTVLAGTGVAAAGLAGPGSTGTAQRCACRAVRPPRSPPRSATWPPTSPPSPPRWRSVSSSSRYADSVYRVAADEPRRGPGRRAGESRTREAILDAARRRFGEQGYDGATIRGIAADARVNPALVHHFYGTKERLFAAAMRLPVVPSEIITFALGAERDRLGDEFQPRIGEVLIAAMLRAWDVADIRTAFLGLLRSAATSEQGVAMLREFVTSTILASLIQVAGLGDDAESRYRATLVASQVIGLGFARYVIGLEPLASATTEDLVAAIGPTMQRYLTGDIGPSGFSS